MNVASRKHLHRAMSGPNHGDGVRRLARSIGIDPTDLSREDLVESVAFKCRNLEVSDALRRFREGHGHGVAA